MDFFRHLHEYYGLSAEAIDQLSAAAEHLCVGRKECLAREGERDPWLYFIEEGSVRTYVMREERCVILNFAFEGDPATSNLGLEAGDRALVTIETLEPSRLIRFPRARIEELFSQSAELANWGRRVSGRILRSHETYFVDYSWRDAGEQYLRLLSLNPALLQRVPLKDLASYLLVTPQTLSRIRAEVHRKLP